MPKENSPNFTRRLKVCLLIPLFTAPLTFVAGIVLFYVSAFSTSGDLVTVGKEQLIIRVALCASLLVSLFVTALTIRMSPNKLDVITTRQASSSAGRRALLTVLIISAYIKNVFLAMFVLSMPLWVSFVAFILAGSLFAQASDAKGVRGEGLLQLFAVLGGATLLVGIPVACFTSIREYFIVPFGNRDLPPEPEL
ncbi:MAG: hypothetical protein ABIP85_26755 [Chthoniobacteraceae bacterium]